MKTVWFPTRKQLALTPFLVSALAILAPSLWWAVNAEHECISSRCSWHLRTLFRPTHNRFDATCGRRIRSQGDCEGQLPISGPKCLGDFPILYAGGEDRFSRRSPGSCDRIHLESLISTTSLVTAPRA